jgi:acetyl-CoA synthetase
MKSRPASDPLPNLYDYDVARADFSWSGARQELDGLPGGQGLNIAHEAVVRHAEGPRASHPAINGWGKPAAARNILTAGSTS